MRSTHHTDIESYRRKVSCQVRLWFAIQCAHVACVFVNCYACETLVFTSPYDDVWRWTTRLSCSRSCEKHTHAHNTQRHKHVHTATFNRPVVIEVVIHSCHSLTNHRSEAPRISDQRQFLRPRYRRIRSNRIHIVDRCSRWLCGQRQNINGWRERCPFGQFGTQAAGCHRVKLCVSFICSDMCKCLFLLLLQNCLIRNLHVDLCWDTEEFFTKPCMSNRNTQRQKQMWTAHDVVLSKSHYTFAEHMRAHPCDVRRHRRVARRVGTHLCEFPGPPHSRSNRATTTATTTTICGDDDGA